jgi:cytosine/adenosine deaminase-related metal-dependent hydrolase
MPSQASILIHSGLVLTLDQSRRILRDGAVAVQDDRIVKIDKTTLVRKDFRADVEIDASHMIILPGLVDLHVHLAQALIRGCADDVSLIAWLRDRVWPLQGSYTHEDGRVSALLCMLEMIKSGTTTFLEAMLHSRYGFDGIAEAVERTGMRGVLSKIVMDQAGYAGSEQIMHPGMMEEKEATVNETLRMHGGWNGKANGRIQVRFGLRSLGACSPTLFREVSALSRERDMGMTMHLNEVREDGEFAERAFRKRPVEFAEEVGLLGPRMVFAHMVWPNPGEIALLAKTQTHVAHCPSSNTKLASGIAPVPEMLRAGVNVGLGCDGGPSNNSYDMIREMKLAAVVHKARLLDPLVLPAEEALEMATIRGARALGMEGDIGSLEAGKKADLILVDSNRPHLTPMTNPVSHLVYAACGEDVHTVIVDGQILMRNRVLATVNEEDILKEAAKRGREVIARAGIDIQPRWPIA